MLQQLKYLQLSALRGMEAGNMELSLGCLTTVLPLLTQLPARISSKGELTEEAEAMTTAQCHQQLGLCLLELGRYLEAHTHLEAALSEMGEHCPSEEEMLMMVPRSINSKVQSLRSGNEMVKSAADNNKMLRRSQASRHSM